MKRNAEAVLPPGSKSGAGWSLYILACADGTYYTGISLDPDRRLAEHNTGRASRYTRTRLPVAMVYREACGSRALALSRECSIKAMPRRRKESLIGGWER